MKKSTLLWLVAGGAALYWLTRRKGGMSGLSDLGRISCGGTCVAAGGVKMTQPIAGGDWHCVDIHGNYITVDWGDCVPFQVEANKKLAKETFENMLKLTRMLREILSNKKKWSKLEPNQRNTLLAIYKAAFALEAEMNSDGPQVYQISIATTLDQAAGLVLANKDMSLPDWVQGALSPVSYDINPTTGWVQGLSDWVVQIRQTTLHSKNTKRR